MRRSSLQPGLETPGRVWLAGLFACLLAVPELAAAPVAPSGQDAREHWAFRAPVRPPTPKVPNADWGGNPIDAFIAAEHTKHGLAASPPVAKNLLLRRVYLDLVGLPPTGDELRAFLADTAPDAYEKAVDRLLASPRYGERWARHWMDVWRYSDWYGRRAVPDVWNSAPQIWRWRDWIVRSLNADKGYDQMIMEMLAADEIAPGDDDAAVATGYLVRNWYALNPNQWMRDNVEHTGKAFLGLTLNCAHCHDHKYDPISQEEYFRFRAFFEPIELRQDRVPGEDDPGPFQKYEYSVLRKVVRIGSIRVFDEKLDAETYVYRMGDERNRVEGKAAVTPAAPAFLGGDRLKLEPIELPAMAYYPGLKPFIRQDAIARSETDLRKALDSWSAARRARAQAAQPAERAAADAALRASDARVASAQTQLESMRGRIAADNARYLGAPGDTAELSDQASRTERKAAFCAAQENLLLAEQTRTAALHQAESDPKAKDAAQKAAAQCTTARAAVASAWARLAAPSGTYTALSPLYPRTTTGRRRALARWIASPDNPLSARVAVNHIWMRHFGRPLVPTVFDFGRNGKAPTHPELLDWLACELMHPSGAAPETRESQTPSTGAWPMKQLHRLIVTSNTYRMQSAATATTRANLGIDPEDVYLWRFPPHRMEAEVVRDSILHASGALDPQMGGPELENSSDSASHRRSLYFCVHPEDGGTMKFFELFDPPDACDCYRRTESMVPQQALALTNSRLALAASRQLARKLWENVAARVADESSRPAAFTEAVFEQLLARRPTANEQTVCGEFLAKQAELFRTQSGAAAAPPAVEGVTAPAADPALRACETLVLALFNHNDFVNVR
jgi:hypothetical protein